MRRRARWRCRREGMALTDLLAAVKLTASKSEALRLVKSGGVYVNNVRMTDERSG